jgi:hypothetical protein
VLSSVFNSILTTTTTDVTFTIGSFLLITFCSLVLGVAVAWIYSFKNPSRKGFLLSLALLPAIVQMVIMLVNGNLGTGVAVMGAFSLVRFRSATGTAREISAIFLAMAVGLATAMGYLAIAAVFVIIMGLVTVAYTLLPFGEASHRERQLKITIPESLDYSGVFDDIFGRYTQSWELVQVRTTNMGSLYKLDYHIQLKDITQEKAFMDELRCRNGNLEILCGKVVSKTDEL